MNPETGSGEDGQAARHAKVCVLTILYLSSTKFLESELLVHDTTKVNRHSEVRCTTLQNLIVDSEVRGTTLQKLIEIFSKVCFWKKL